MAEIILSDDNFDKEVIQSKIPVLVDFWAPWCGPCRMMAPAIEELARDMDGKAKVCKLNTDENPVIPSQYRITAIPSLLFFKGGQLADTLVGVQSKEALKKKLEGLTAG